MTDFVSAMDVSANYTFTENGQLSFTTKGVNSNILALYFKLVRGASEEQIMNLVYKVKAHPTFLEDLIVLTFQTRDVRGGKGERQLFYILFLYLYYCFQIYKDLHKYQLSKKDKDPNLPY